METIRGPERPLTREEGLSAARERRWGWIGGVVGSVVGIGSAAVAMLVDGAPPYESGPWPAIFREPRILGMDVYLGSMLVVGAGFSIAGLVHARRSGFPRTDAYGAGLVGALLMLLSGTILFTRVLALVSRGGS
jgi:vacuolar-type H+-ATPase subunit I/STV1